MLAGIELDIFTLLGEKSLSTAELAQKTGTVGRGLEILLNALSGLGLLKKNAHGFSNTELSLKYLNTSSPASITNYLLLTAQMWSPWQSLTRALKGKINQNSREGHDHPKLKNQFSLAVNERSVNIIPKLLQYLTIGEATSLLDLGGGDGSYAFALLEKYPQLVVTVFDCPSMIKAATIRAFNLGLITQVNFKAGDFFSDSLGGPYDIVFLSNIIHIFGDTENRRLLEKIATALTPGGRVIIVDAFLEGNGTCPPEAAMFSVELFLQTASGRCYAWTDVTEWLEPLGFGGFKYTRFNDRVAVLEARLNLPRQPA